MALFSVCPSLPYVLVVLLFPLVGTVEVLQMGHPRGKVCLDLHSGWKGAAKYLMARAIASVSGWAPVTVSQLKEPLRK